MTRRMKYLLKLYTDLASKVYNAKLDLYSDVKLNTGIILSKDRTRDLPERVFIQAIMNNLTHQYNELEANVEIIKEKYKEYDGLWMHQYLFRQYLRLRKKYLKHIKEVKSFDRINKNTKRIR